MGKKWSICLKDVADLDFFFLFFYFFPIFFDKCCLICRLRKAYAVLSAANRFVGSGTSKHNAFDQFLKFKFHFENFSWNTKFLSFDPVIICIYLRTNYRHFRNQGKVRHPISTLPKMWFGPSTKYLAVGKVSLVCFNYWSSLSVLSITLIRLVFRSTQIGTSFGYSNWYPMFLFY